MSIYDLRYLPCYVYSFVCSEAMEMAVTVLEAKDLLGPPATTETFIDSYVRVYLLPDTETTAQTRVYRSSNSPSYKERFLFRIHPKEQSQRSLYFHIFAMDNLSHTLIGEGEIRLMDISLRQPVTTWVTLTDSGPVSHYSFNYTLSILTCLPKVANQYKL